MKLPSIAAATLVLVVAGVAAQESPLVPLAYNHPGLVVDLGVGLWAWPIPWDVDHDGDTDLLVSCPDKPSNGVWLFENRSGPGVEMPVFEPGRRIGPTQHYVTPSYIGGTLRVLRMNTEWPEFAQTGLTPGREIALPLPVTAHTALIGTQPKGQRIRHNVWKYVDFDGDGAARHRAAAEDWTDYGWDDAYDAEGRWMHGPLHGVLYLLRNEGTTAAPGYEAPRRWRPVAGGSISRSACRRPTSPTSTATATSTCCAASSSTASPTSRTSARGQQPRYAAARPVPSVTGERLRMDLEMIVPVAFDWDRDGDLDLIVGDEDGRVACVENTGRLDATRTPVFLPPRLLPAGGRHAEVRRPGHARRARTGTATATSTSSAATPPATSGSSRT